MSKIDDLNRQAREAFNANLISDAALLWRQASDQALELGQTIDWFKYRVWSSNTLWFLGEYVQAMDLLLEAHLHAPPDCPVRELWLAKEIQYQVCIDTLPRHQQLNRFLEELEELNEQLTIPKGELTRLQADFLYIQRDIPAALIKFEQAWQESDGNWYVKYELAYQAARCCLKLKKVSAAKDWKKAGIATKEIQQGRLINGAELDILFALADVDWERLPILLSCFEDSYGKSGVGNGFYDITTRVHLLNDVNLDPLKPSHPAQQSLLHPLLIRKSLHVQFSYRLAILDFRLAALRFAVGIKPVDDLYYTQAQQLPSKPLFKTTGSDVKKRLQRVLISCKNAKQYAKKIDDLLQCDGRQQGVITRLERIQEIEEWLAGNE